MIVPTEIDLNEQDHEDAFTEVGFLLQMLASTVEDVIGNPAPLGISAGRAMANKLPFKLRNPKLDQALEALAKTLHGGMALTWKMREGGAEIEVGPCAVRELCKRQNEPVGSKVCRLFHHYISGVTSQLYGKQARIIEKEVGETCILDLLAK